MARAIIEAKGFLSGVALQMRCNPATVHRYIEKYKVCREALWACREGLKDKAEAVLVERIEAGDVAVSKYYLEAQAPERGYGNKAPSSSPADPTRVSVLAQHNTLNMLNLSNKELMNAIRQLALPGATASAGVLDLGSTSEGDVASEPSVVGSDERPTPAG